ncbi:MAG: DUF479 domain-containing protein [Planctomycetes bacterium]|nr:DUF479 domain-containing protein [Planctomycetota bacterium]
MNYVAHAFLAPRTPLGLLGNMLGDFVKGGLPGELEPELAAAVAQHRRIDALCDRHPAFVASRRRLFGSFSHYAGVIVDVLYDHLLFDEWDRYADVPFDAFVDYVYDTVDRERNRLPPVLATEADRLVEVDAFRRYRTPDDLREALRRLGLRTRRPVELPPAVDRFLADRDAFAGEFRAVFDALTSLGDTLADPRDRRPETP